MRSESRGRVQLRSKDPNEHPSILFNYMSQEQDWVEFRAGIRITRNIMQQDALAPYLGREISPGSNLQTDAEIDDFVRKYAETAYHPCGTCAMGFDELSVVDAEGRVHGLQARRRLWLRQRLLSVLRSMKLNQELRRRQKPDAERQPRADRSRVW